VVQYLATPWRLLISLAVLLITVLSLSLLAVRWLTRPLAILADAAEHLGRDIHHSPLQENGPTEVRQAAHAFNTMQTRLSRYLEDRARILIAVSHDLKTPITRLNAIGVGAIPCGCPPLQRTAFYVSEAKVFAARKLLPRKAILYGCP